MSNRNLFLALMVFGLIAPWIPGMYPVLLMKMLAYGLFAIAFNLLIGYTGLLSFGHAAYFGSSAYLAGYVAKNFGFSPELAVVSGTVLAGALGYVAGSIAIRRQGIYFAMITLALAQIVFLVCLKWDVTGGEDGLQGVPRGNFLGLISLESDNVMYYFVFGFFCAAFWLVHRVIHSPFGWVLKAIRENEPRAVSLGYDTDKFKLICFVISCAIAGTAGALLTLTLSLASLSNANWHQSGEVVLMTLLGGIGTVLGPMVGAFVIVVLHNQLADIGSWIQVVIGTIFVVCVMAFRRGIVGEIGHLMKRSF